MSSETSDSIGGATAPDENASGATVQADAKPEATSSGADSSPAGESSDKDSEKRVPWFQKRIDEITRDKYEERRARENAERRAQELEQQLKTVSPPAVDVDTEPLKSIEDFNYDSAEFSKYLQKRIDDIAEKRASAAAEKRIEQWQREQNESKAKAEYTSRIEAFRKDAPDFDAVVFSDETPISENMAQIIQRHELGPAIAYHLGKNRETAAAIYRLDPALTAFELGQIAASIKSARSVTRADVPKAPPPVPRLDATGEPSKKSPDAMTDDEYYRWRLKERQKQKR